MTAKYRRENWEITRQRNQHFTPAEMQVLEQGFRNGLGPTAVARELRASLRTIQTHFARLRAEQQVKRYSPAARRESRFYKSNFEL